LLIGGVIPVSLRAEISKHRAPVAAFPIGRAAGDLATAGSVESTFPTFIVGPVGA
jgi:hypothetical protein